MNWNSFFMGAGAGIVLMAVIACWAIDWFARGLDDEDFEETEEQEAADVPRV